MLRWDHPIFGIAHAVEVNTASAPKNNATLAAELVELYLETRTGPLSIFGPGYYGFEKLPEPYRSALSVDTVTQLDKLFPADWPEIEWLPNPTYNGNNTNKITADPVDGKNYATMSLALIAPLSRGRVTLNSPHMWDLPTVDPQWFTAQADKEIAIQAFRRVREMWQIFVDLGIADQEEAYPGPQVQTDEEILDWIGRSMLTVYHAAATNKMGQASDPMAVVDRNARVFGTENLRIVDASAFPFLTPVSFHSHKTTNETVH